MRRLLYLAALSMVIGLVFGATAVAQEADECPVGTNLTEGGTCVPQDDRCPPGQVFTEESGGCVPGDLIPGTASPAAPAASAQYEQYVTPVAQTPAATTTLPDTGGPALLLPLGAGLLLAGGLAVRIMRWSFAR